MKNRDGFYPLSDFAWPVTYIFHMSVPWGLASVSLTLDVPSLEMNFEATAASVRPVWQGAIAPAISFLTSYVMGDGYCWKVGHYVDGDDHPVIGEAASLPLGKDRGVAVVMQTGDADKAGRRRLILPTCPRSWADSSGQLTETGADEGLTYARGIFGGLNGSIENAPMQWLLPYANAYRDPVTGLTGPGFRPVTSLRLCSYTVPVPDYRVWDPLDP